MFAMILVAAAALPLAPPDGVYTYTVSVAGNNAGKTAITASRAAGGVQLAESATASYGGADFAASATLNLDTDLSPARYTAVYSPPGRTIHAALAFAGATATETADTGDAAFKLSPNTAHFAVLDGTMFSGFFILPSQLQAWRTQSYTAVAPMFGRAVTMSLDRALKPNRPAGVPANDAVISVSDPVEFTLWYDPATLIVDELDVPSQDASYVRLRSS